MFKHPIELGVCLQFTLLFRLFRTDGHTHIYLNNPPIVSNGRTLLGSQLFSLTDPPPTLKSDIVLKVGVIEIEVKLYLRLEKLSPIYRLSQGR